MSHFENERSVTATACLFRRRRMRLPSTDRIRITDTTRSANLSLRKSSLVMALIVTIIANSCCTASVVPPVDPGNTGDGLEKALRGMFSMGTLPAESSSSSSSSSSILATSPKTSMIPTLSSPRASSSKDETHEDEQEVELDDEEISSVGLLSSPSPSTSTRPVSSSSKMPSTASPMLASATANSRPASDSYKSKEDWWKDPLAMFEDEEDDEAEAYFPAETTTNEPIKTTPEYKASSSRVDSFVSEEEDEVDTEEELDLLPTESTPRGKRSSSRVSATPARTSESSNHGAILAALIPKHMGQFFSKGSPIQLLALAYLIKNLSDYLPRAITFPPLWGRQERGESRADNRGKRSRHDEDSEEEEPEKDSLHSRVSRAIDKRRRNRNNHFEDEDESDFLAEEEDEVYDDDEEEYSDEEDYIDEQQADGPHGHEDGHKLKTDGRHASMDMPERDDFEDAAEMEPSQAVKEPSKANRISVFRRVGHLFALNRPRMPPRAVLMEQVDELTERCQLAERQKAAVEGEYERTSWQLQEAQSELSSLKQTTRYLQAQLRDNEEMLQRVVKTERRKAKDELVRMKEAMLKVVEREREAMRDEFIKQAGELEEMIQSRQQQSPPGQPQAPEVS